MCEDKNGKGLRIIIYLAGGIMTVIIPSYNLFSFKKNSRAESLTSMEGWNRSLD
jgi:hypothetical protein